MREGICNFTLNIPLKTEPSPLIGTVFPVLPNPTPNLLELKTTTSIHTPTLLFFTLLLGSSQNSSTHLQLRGFEEEGREWTDLGILILIAQQQRRLYKKGTDGYTTSYLLISNKYAKHFVYVTAQYLILPATSQYAWCHSQF